jgi:transcriptional regulator with XRE-family HTH domain
MKSFAETIRTEREKQGLFLRQVAAALEIDQAMISKFEKGDRKPSKEQVEKIADFFDINKDELITLWLSDKILYTIQGEENAEKALKVAEQQIRYSKTKLSQKV